MRRSLAFALTVCALLLPPGASSASAQYRPRPVYESPAAETFLVEGTFGLWSPSPALSLSSEGLGIPGSTIDLVQDLGLERGLLTDVRATVRVGRKHKFRFQLSPIGYTQTTSLKRDLVFNGQRYPANASVTSELSWKAYRISYEYDFINLSRGFGGLVLDLKPTLVRAALRAPGIDEQSRLRVQVPAIGGIARVYVNPTISITGELSGMKVPAGSFGDSGGHYAEVDIYGTFNLTPRVAAQAGFRAIDVAASVDQDAAAFTLKGLYVGVVVRR